MYNGCFGHCGPHLVESGWLVLFYVDMCIKTLLGCATVRHCDDKWCEFKCRNSDAKFILSYLYIYE